MRESKPAQGNSLNVQTQFIEQRKFPIFSLTALVLGESYDTKVLSKRRAGSWTNLFVSDTNTETAMLSTGSIRFSAIDAYLRKLVKNTI